MRRVRGFTLAEVLVTIVVVGTALVVISQGVTLGLRSSMHSENHTQATLMLDEVVARCETGEISLSEDSEDELPEVAAGFRYAVEVETPGDPPDLVLAHITIRWSEEGDRDDARRSLVADRWFYTGTADAAGGVTRGPQVGSAEQGGQR